MNNKKLNRIIVMILLFTMLFNTSLSYAAGYSFVSGTNAVDVMEFTGGYTFTVPETGVYSITILPIVDGYEWEYDLKTNSNRSARSCC